MGTSDRDAVPPDTLSSDIDPVDAPHPAPKTRHLPDSPPVPIAQQSCTLPPEDAAGYAQVAPPQVAHHDPVAEAVEVLDRAQADRELFELLLVHGVDGVVWERLVAALVAYAAQVLDVWISRGEIYTQVVWRFPGRQFWLPAQQRLARDPHYREDFVDHTIVRALEKLQIGLRTGTGWNPAKGRTLRSYFIDGCLHEFVYVFDKEQRWWRTHQTEQTVDHTEDTETTSSPHILARESMPGSDPADVVCNRIVLADHLASLSDYNRTVLWAHVNGYTHAEIAHLFPDTTPKAIERRLHRLRQHARNSVRTRG